MPHPLSDVVVELLAERMFLLGEPTRIMIIDVLRDGKRNVQSISDCLRTIQQNVSGHLRLLRDGGIVSRRPVGREVFYEASDETVFNLWEQLIAGAQQR